MGFSNKSLLAVALCASAAVFSFQASAQDAVGNATVPLIPNNAELNAPVANNAVKEAIAEDAEESDVFYDAEAIVPNSEIGKKVARKIDPRTQPASKLIIVKTDHNASTRQAGLASAQRALKLGRYEAALEMYNRMYTKNKRDANILMGRAVALQNLERYDEAIQAYDAVLALKPKHKDARINKLGLVADRYPSVALRQLGELYDQDPDNVGVLAQLAVASARLGEIDEALKYLSIAASLQPENANHIYNMAVVADKAKRHKEAISYYEKALEIDSIYHGGRTLPRDEVFVRLAQIR